jgi:hypothetical protein
MAEESVYLKTKKIRLLSIDRLLEGEALVSVAESLLRITDLRSNIFFFFFFFFTLQSNSIITAKNMQLLFHLFVTLERKLIICVNYETLYCYLTKKKPPF